MLVGHMRILLLGCRGQIGSELHRALASLGEVTALGRERSGDLCGDLEALDDLRRTVQRVRPDVIANAAAYTDVDRAESDADRAERINAEAPGVLAEEAARLNAWLVQYSTDYVFDGTGTTPWQENDEPAPLSVYGATKWRSEQRIRAAGCKHLIFRTQWVYAPRGRNFVRTILRLAAERDALEVIDDQYGAPTGAELVANVTAEALRIAAARPDLAGTYHLAARGETTWHAYARFIVGAARQAGRPVRVADTAILRVATGALPTAARRPRNSRLDTRRLEQAFGLRLPEWQPGVLRALTELESP